MITFLICLLALALGYVFYGSYVQKVFGPDDRATPAVTMADGVDYVRMPRWKVFMIQFLNIAGTGPIFGAIMGAKFGPVAYLWIVLGCIFAGAVHDYFAGMMSMRCGGADLPMTVRRYLGRGVAGVLTVFSVFLLLMVGTVFVYSPALILDGICGSRLMWVGVIFVYYFIATMLPIDKIIGRIYPLFSFSLLFMAVALFAVLLVRWPSLPELWHGLGAPVQGGGGISLDDVFPALFITIACGAISGFHATQSPLMARCLDSERHGRGIFYGAMITEGMVALVWATVSMWFFYCQPEPGYTQIASAVDGAGSQAPLVVSLVCSDWLGVAGGILALLGVVAAPVTSGDTAFRSARLIVAQSVGLDQHSKIRRIYICVPLFAASLLLLMWQIENPDGFNTIWQYFGWGNQTLSVFTLWAITVYLARRRKPYVITLVPALFMTAVCSSFVMVSPNALGMSSVAGYVAAAVVCAVFAALFFRWKMRLGVDADGSGVSE